MTAASPLLDAAGAVAADGPDAGVAAHYGDPFREQRTLAAGRGVVDLSHRGVVCIGGPDRLTWLHGLTSQHLETLAPGVATTALVLSPQGRVEHVLYLVDDGETVWAGTEPGAGAALAAFLDSMRFLMRVEVTDRSADLGMVWRPGPTTGDGDLPVRAGTADTLGGHERFVALADLESSIGDEPRAGVWAHEALRIAAGVPRMGLDTDDRAIPNELGWIPSAVHLDKGCYRGQETVGRVHTLGRPPRRLVLLHLDGSTDDLPAHGATVTGPDGQRPVGAIGSSARHHELGPIALALIKRSVPVDAALVAEGTNGPVAAAQEVLVDPEVGLHVRPRLGGRSTP